MKDALSVLLQLLGAEAGGEAQGVLKAVESLVSARSSSLRLVTVEVRLRDGSVVVSLKNTPSANISSGEGRSDRRLRPRLVTGVELFVAIVCRKSLVCLQLFAIVV